MFPLRRSTIHLLNIAGMCLLMPLLATSAPSTCEAQSPALHASEPLDFASLPPEARGDLLMARGSYAAAIDAYQQAWPRSASIWNKTGLAYHHLYALDEAMKDYQMALTLDHHFSQAYNNLGAVYHGKHEYGLAEREYKRAIKYQPRSAVSYCNLGTTYFAEYKYKKGIKAYQKAIEVDPQAFNPGHDQIEEGTQREARVATAYNLAKVYASAGRNEDALAALRKAVSAGFNDRKRLMADKEFASLRETAEFHQLMVEEHLE
jgi:tetratricopeptide (TPR) repeat protein